MINLFNWDGTKYLSEMLSKLVSIVPNIVSALIILFVGLFIAKIISKLIIKILRKVKIDKLSDKLQNIDFIEKMNLDIRLSSIIGKFLYYFLILIILVISTDILGMPIISNLIVSIFNFIPNLLVALLLLIFGILLANWLKGIVYTVAKSLGLPSASIISNLVFYFIFINILISALVQAKVNIEFFSTNISLIIGGVIFAFALAYGLASKNIMSNIISSFYYKNTYNIGDYVKIGKYEGEICSKDNFSITLCIENKKIVIPISKLNEMEVVITSKD